MDRREFALGAGALIAAAGLGGAAVAQSDMSSRARSVWRRATIVDGNLGPPISQAETPLPQADLDTARNSGVSAIKTSIGGFENSFEDTLAELALYQRIIEGHPDYYTQIRGVADIAAAKRARQLGIIFSFEGVACLEDKVDRIDLFRNLGVRVMQLSYNLPSPFGAGVMSPPDSGLTELGLEAVARMNAVGVAVDLSHSNAATTEAAMAASTKPVLITHGGCSAVFDHPRNKSDAQLRALAEKGGVFGIYDLPYISPETRQPNLDDYIAHMVHALEVCGEDHVGIGSDTAFAGLDLSEESRAAMAAQVEARRAAGVSAPGEDRMPYTEGLNRADRALVIADALLKRGYRERAVEKVLGGNFIRAFGEIW